MNVDRYLARLGVARPAAPTLAALRELHAAHVERVPYETFDLYLRRPTSIDPAQSAARIAVGRGGFCYHLNGAFALLLSELGYAVTQHRAGVQPHHDSAPPGADGNHLALTVSGLPTPTNPEGRWLVDVGLGDALHQPIPLVLPTRKWQGPFAYVLRPSEVVPDGWRFDHDPAGSFAGCDIAAEPAGPDDFTEMSQWLSTSPESPFVRVAVAQCRDRGGVDIVRGCMLTRIDAAGKQTTILNDRGDWFRVLRERFGLGFAEYDPDTRDELWHRVRAQHAEYEASRAQHPPTPAVAS